MEIGADGTVAVADASVDVVLSTQVLEHVTDPAVYLAECVRVLRPGGRLLLTTHGTMFYHPDPVDYWRWTCDGLRKAVTDAGLEVTRFEGVVGMAATGLQLVQEAFYYRLPRRLAHLFALRACRRWRGSPTASSARAARHERDGLRPRRREAAVSTRWQRFRHRRRLARMAGARLLAAFADAHPAATFVEIGANDGERHDHLRGFILERDWRGLMVEPLPDLFARLVANYAGVDRVTARPGRRLRARRHPPLLPPRAGPVAALLAGHDRLVRARRARSRTASEIPDIEVADRHDGGADADLRDAVRRARASSGSTWSSATPRVTTGRSCGPSTSTVTGRDWSSTSTSTSSRADRAAAREHFARRGLRGPRGGLRHRSRWTRSPTRLTERFRAPRAAGGRGHRAMTVLHVACGARRDYAPHSAAMLHSVLTSSPELDDHRALPARAATWAAAPSPSACGARSRTRAGRLTRTRSRRSGSPACAAPNTSRRAPGTGCCCASSCRTSAACSTSTSTRSPCGPCARWPSSTWAGAYVAAVENVWPPWMAALPGEARAAARAGLLQLRA